VIGKPKGKKQLGKPKCRRKGNNEMELVETEYENVDRVHLVLDSNLWDACKHGYQPSGSIKGL
jgi:hypothetical protein